MATTYDSTKVGRNTNGNVYTIQEWMALDSTKVGFAGEGDARLREGYERYVGYEQSTDFEKQKIENKRSLTITNGVANVQADTAAIDAAADFRKKSYEAYRNKYTQHAQTTLGSSSGASKVVIG